VLREEAGPVMNESIETLPIPLVVSIAGMTFIFAWMGKVGGEAAPTARVWWERRMD
jgi:hypothetical protein